MEELNDKQRQAVFSTEKRIVCIAGPGSGKTKTMIARIMHLIKSGVSAKNIMALTFTNKAAREINQRLGKIRIEAGTFHSVFYHIICQYYRDFGFEQIPNIYDEADIRDLIRVLIPYTMTSYTIEMWENLLIRKYQNLEDKFTAHEVHLIETFEGTMIADAHALSFDMILYWLYRVLKAKPILLGEIRNRYTHIFVDEYQDTNRIQSEIIRLLNPENIFVVGDLDQAIYGWRGAKLDELMSFANEPGTEVIYLDRSYRCPQNILNAAYNLIQHNEIGFQQAMKSANKRKGEYYIYRFYDEEQMHEFIHEITLFGEDVAVLCRTNREATSIHKYLTNVNVNVLLLTSEKHIYQEDIIKTIMAYVRLVRNNQDVYSLYRVGRLPTREWNNPRIRSEIRKEALQVRMAQIKIVENRYPSDPIFKFLSSVTLATPATKAFKILFDIIKLEEYLGELHLHNKADKIKTFYDRMLSWEQRVADSSLGAWLEFIDFLEIQDKLLLECAKVKVMTMHTAKGLEFETVIVPSVSERNIPNSRSDLEEERRLLYVAITRARKDCYLLWSETSITRYNNVIGNQKSRFLEEIYDGNISTPGKSEGTF